MIKKDLATLPALYRLVSLGMGNTLFDEVTRLTGLPQEGISDELLEIIQKIGATPEQLTIEQLRQAMLFYLQDLLNKNPEIL